jgi:hypothetical protein
MDVHIKASNEVGHRVLRGINRKRPVFMKDAGKQQNAKKQKKTELFYTILFISLILLVVLRVTGPIVIAIWNLFF